MREHWPALLLALAWVASLASTAWRFRASRRLDEFPPVPAADAPLVSVVVPARDEARNIAECLRGILATAHPAVEVLVVDDHSKDGTGAIARAVAARDPRVRVLDAPALPPGWFGKQWACHTGAREARGAILCFTDADTRHGPELLGRSVTAMRTLGADLFTVAGRQEMRSFWERVVQPVVFTMLLSRYGGLETMSRSPRPVDKIANGQFLCLTREAYDAVGGHAAVRSHVAEDLRLAQLVTERGRRMHMVLAQDHLSTRMYHSLGEIRRGWGKNVLAAGRDTLPLGRVGRLLFPVLLPLGPLLPAVPFVTLALAAAGILGPGAWWFGAITFPANLLFWTGVYAFSRQSPLWAPLHPLGALTFSLICAEAAWKGSRVEWKGRRYDSESVAAKG